MTSEPVRVTVSGSAIDAAIKEGAIYNFDFSSRTNQETDHSIVSGNYEMKVDGANWTTNGFGTFLGENCLRVAENVGVSLNLPRLPARPSNPTVPPSSSLSLPRT